MSGIARNSIRVLIALTCGVSAADASRDHFAFGHTATRIQSLDGWSGTVRVTDLESVIEVTIAYAYPNGERGVVTAESTDEANTYAFRIPPEPDSPPGELTYSAEALYGMHGTDRLASDSQRIPVSHAQELDITGEAAEVLLYPLAGDGYTVRYIPCCNIYGGMTYAERLAVNPVETGEGLPEKLVSDFIVLKPDGLSASTMGMYFDFNLGPDAFRSIESGTPALFEFDGQKWVEVQTYELNRDAGTVSIHTPTGGEYVLGIKP